MQVKWDKPGSLRGEGRKHEYLLYKLPCTSVHCANGYQTVTAPSVQQRSLTLSYGRKVHPVQLKAATVRLSVRNPEARCCYTNSQPACCAVRDLNSRKNRTVYSHLRIKFVLEPQDTHPSALYTSPESSSFRETVTELRCCESDFRPVTFDEPH
jgi:hypothetical protein